MPANDELEKLKGDVHIPLLTLLKRVLTYLKPEKKRFVLALLVLVINVALNIISPLFVSGITNNLKSVHISLRIIIGFSVIFVLIGLLNQAFLYIQAMLLQNAGQNIIYRLRMEVFEHIENMSQNQFNEMPVGSLVTRVASYTQSMSDLFTNVLVKVLQNVLTVIGTYCIMLYISWKLSLIMLIFIFFIGISSYIFAKKVGQIFREDRRYI
ncbi:MAG: hypothetical protein HUJ58_01200, partial [Erysipelotrichaceae bacterium]|nr:hypothetical protein [Erysipelotrichaceae bacterium]